MLDTRLLIVLDDSEGTRRAIEYVAKFVGRRKGFHICLVHVLRPLPPELLEHGGSEDPSKEALLERDLQAERSRWIATAKRAAQKHLDQAGAVLRKAGVPAGALQSLFCESGDGREVADRLFNMGKECQCRTVVVGRRSVSWFHELFSRDLSEELLRCGKGFCVWAVE